MLCFRSPFGVSADSSSAPVSRVGRSSASKLRSFEHSFLLRATTAHAHSGDDPSPKALSGRRRGPTGAEGRCPFSPPNRLPLQNDGKRVYWTNSLYSTWDTQFYPDGVPGAQVMANANANGGLALAKDYWVNFPDGYRAHQIRLEGGDCSTDSFCYPSV
jgi:56kDa selenium binding protein (SBP56)